TVKFSTDKTSNLPYILPRASWMSGASAVEFDEDGDTKFVWWATPSTAKFNVNHNLLSGSAAVSNEGDSAIDNYIFYYFTPDSLRSPVAKDILKYKSLYDTGATPLPIYGKRYRFADEFFLVSGVGMGVYRTSAPSVFNIIELSASYHPLNIGNWRIYPYIINHSNKETVIGNAGIISAKPTPFGINNPYGSPGEAKTYADLIANALYDGRITNNTNLYDGVGAGLTTRHGALYEFLKTINDMNYSNFSSDPDRGNWLKDFFMLNSIGGLHSIPVAFGPTYALGKYMYWEINIEGYANWQGSGADRRPKRIKRLRAEVAVPIYKNQPAPDNKIKVIFWAEDWSSGKWRISNY
ncbi:MAG TPA: hypothetical protein PLM75_13180, partial [bacterium]|nr:hypothetical protein [bacterium]